MEAVDPAGVVRAEPVLFAGRFERTRLLKHGQGVSTHAGIDREDGSPVVIKTVRADDLSEAARLRLEHEAHVLRRLTGLDGGSPFVAVGQEADLLYLVQPYVPGVTLRHRLVEGALPVRSALRVGIDVLRALQKAHDSEVLHRDVKPANVIVDEHGPITRATLIDFGFARSAWLDASIRDEPVGSARYLAPEAAGALGAEVDERADLYAVGVVLFESLAGRPPFEGTSVGEVLRQHLNVPAPLLRSIGLAVPRALDAAIQRLLRKDPDERYQTAAGVLADLEEIAVRLDEGAEDPAVVIGLHDRRQALTEPAFVGRSEELRQLARFLEKARAGRGRLVLVEAESGVGKSRLLDELAQQAEPAAWILRGQGVDQAAPRPYQVLEGVASAILAAVRDRPALAAALRRRLGERAPAAATALPALARVLAPGAPRDTGPEAYAELRSTEALSVLLDALGSPERPAVVLLDDCQWADTLTLSLLSRWREGAGQGTHVLIVAAYRSEEVGPDHVLRSIPSATRIALAPFAPPDVRSLAESMAGPLPQDVVAEIARLSEGNPFMTAAVLRGLVESGALEHTEAGWQIDPAGMANVQTSRRAALFLAQRLELLSLAARHLLSVAAVVGKEFDLALVLTLAGLGREEAGAALHEASRRRIVWVDEQTSHCTFLHDKLREALLGRMDEETRRLLHERAALVIEAGDAERVFDLAYHFDAAGRGDRALPYALRAAELARSRHSLEIATTHYRIAERAAGDADVATRLRVAEGLGDVLTLQGRYDEALTHLERAKSLVGTRDTAHRAELEGKLGNVAFKKGDPRLARRHLEGALRSLGQRVPARTAGYLLALAWEVAVQALHTLLPRLFVGRRPLEEAGDELLAMRLYSRLAYVYWFHSGRVPCGWAHLREMNLAERYRPTAELAQAYSEHAPVMTMLPWFKRGIAYAERSLAIRRELGDVWGQGQSLGFYGVVLYASARYREAIERCREAIRLLEPTGDRWEANTAAWHVAFAHYRLGELRQAADLARRLHADATAIGDRAAAGISLSAWARATAGLVPPDLVRAALAEDTEDAHTSSEVHLAQAVRLLGEGRIDEAVEVLDATVALVERAGLRQEYVAPVYPWLASARRLQVEALPPYRWLERRPLLAAAHAAARRAHRIARSYPNNLPHALRELGLVAVLRGRSASARRHLSRSLAEAEAQGARYEYALTRQAWVRAGVALGWRETASLGADALEAADEAVRTMLPPREEPDEDTRAVAGLSLADRFAGLLSVGRELAAATSVEAVHRGVREAGLNLLRGEQCHVLALGEDALEAIVDSSESSAGASDGVSSTLVRRAVTTAAPVVWDGGLGEATDSVVLSGQRSVLCAPILSDDRPVACFYVTHARVGGLFSEEEVKLAEFIATLAGAALEHLAGTEARFRSLAQNSSDVITIVDRDGLIEYQSSSVERVFGLPPGQLLGTEFAAWVHPEDRDEALLVLHEAARGGVRPLLECRLRHADGSWRYVETALNDLFDDPSVRGLVLNSRDVSERQALEAELRDRALRDNLTRLANRGLFMDRVGHYLSWRTPVRLALVYIDLDEFKTVNDTLGHRAGDLLLRQVADRLLACVRPHDTVARLGGDEFGMLLEDVDVEEAIAVAERVQAALAEPFDVGGQEVRTRVSTGVAATSDGDIEPEELLSQADAAMYVAKASGKGHYEVFEPGMRAAALERINVKHDLQRATYSEELVIHYQPIVEVGTGRVTSLEALLRWRHPARGLLMPEDFIAVAEESGLIIPIGAWVLRQACEQAALLQGNEVDGRPVGMNVNVSIRQLQHPGLRREIVSALDASGFDPRLLTLEITESASVQDPEATIARLRELKALGIRLAIDDFGTGYSSLSYLRRFPVDQLKIDRSFVAGLGRSGEDSAIVANVVGLAHALGLQAVAEGVERIEQLEHLARLGCDLAQGYNWRRPAQLDEVRRWMAALAGRLRGQGEGGGGRPRVLLVDDRPEVLAALRVAVELDSGFVVVAEARDGHQAIAAAARHQPDLIVLDLAMPGLGGLEALPRLRTIVPSAGIVVVTAIDLAEVPAWAEAETLAVLDKTDDLTRLAGRLSALVGSNAA